MPHHVDRIDGLTDNEATCCRLTIAAPAFIDSHKWMQLDQEPEPRGTSRGDGAAVTLTHGCQSVIGSRA